METVFYRVYCRGILGVKTNVPGFKWVYGSTAPDAAREEYEECKIKLEAVVVPEKALTERRNFDKSFQAYSWDQEMHTISCLRTFFLNVKIGYNIRIANNTIYAEIGENYYRFVKNRTMNLHGMYYLLSDLANMLLLKNGYLTLYASAVYYEPKNKCLVNFAPPNTGKTLTVSKLCELPGYKLVGEDVVITDGEKVYSCPWTCSYRGKQSVVDSAGSMRRNAKMAAPQIEEKCVWTDLAVLSLGEKAIITDPHETLNRICILNGYLFGYFSTPILKLLAYFDKEYYQPWNEMAEAMLKQVVGRVNCCVVQAETAMDFYELIRFDAGI